MTRPHANSAHLRSASWPSQSLSRSVGQNLEQGFEKPGHEAQACVGSKGEEQGGNHLETITIEELADGELDNVSEADVIRPDGYEDADPLPASEVGDQTYDSQADTPSHRGIIEGLRTLRCGSDDDEHGATKGRERRKKRRSVGVFKRSHSQIIGNDTEEELPDTHGLEHSARRLRRRVRGPDGDASLEGTPSTELECEELEDVVSFQKPPIESDMEDYSTESLSMDTTEDAMEVD